jgi:hypothetical protein
MTDQWYFVAAAYVLTLLGTGAVIWGSWRSMRQAESRAQALSRSDKA